MRHTRFVVTHHGGPDALRVVDEQCPEPKNGEVRVRVLAAGVAMPDIMARQGIHPETPHVPFTPGRNLAGEAERLGNGVSGVEPGRASAPGSISFSGKTPGLSSRSAFLSSRQDAHRSRLRRGRRRQDRARGQRLIASARSGATVGRHGSHFVPHGRNGLQS